MVNKPNSLRTELPLPEIEAFCRRWRIVRFEVFGSAIRDDFGPGSDLDFLYTFAPDARWGLNFMDAWDELERIVGRKVDLVSRPAVERSPNWIRRRAILDAAELLYAA